jgi:hypothetical protein
VPSPPSSASRSAERFADALDGGATGDPETGRLTALAHRLEAVPGSAIAPRPAAKAAALAAFSAGGLELAHHAAAPTTAVHGVLTTAKVTGIGHGLLLPIATGLTAAAVAVGGVGLAAHRSLPGDPFYGVKRATEVVQQHLAGGGVPGAKERLAIARTRLAEIRQEAAAAPTATRTSRIASLVAAMDREVALASGPMATAGGPALLLLQTSVAELNAGLAALPADAVGPAVVRSEALLGALTTATAKLPTGGLPGITAVPTPVPTSLPTALPTGLIPTPGATTAPTPTTRPTTAPTPSTAPTHAPTTRPSGLPTLPTSLPTSGLPTIRVSIPGSVHISVPSLPVAISSVLSGLLDQ